MGTPDRPRSSRRAADLSNHDAEGPVHVTAEVVGNRVSGAFHLLTVRAAGLGDQVRPGQFVLVSVPEPRLARRALWIHQARRQGPHHLIDLVVAAQGPGTAWLTGLPEGGLLTVTGPLGRPFALPRQPVGCLLVGESWHAAPLFALAERLAARECPVTLLIGAPDHTAVLASQNIRRSLRESLVTTTDGSLGLPGGLLEVLPQVVDRVDASVYYASASTAVSAAVAAEAEARGAWSQVTVHSAGHGFSCGTGLCHGCPVPALSEGGRVREVRSCTEGPVFRGDRVAWSALAPEGER